LYPYQLSPLFCKPAFKTITIRHGETQTAEETFLPRLWLLPVLQRVPLCVVPLHLRHEREEGQEAEDAQTAFSEILIFSYTSPLPPLIKGNLTVRLSIDV